MSAAKGVQRVIGEETHLFARATRIYRDLYPPLLEHQISQSFIISSNTSQIEIMPQL